MAETPACNWIGASGTSYRYFIHKLPASFDANQPGNYIFTKVNAENKWVPIYIGQGDLGDAAAAERELHRIERMSEMMAHGPFLKGLGLGDEEAHILLREMPRMMHHLIRRSMEGKKPSRRRRIEPPESPQS